MQFYICCIRKHYHEIQFVINWYMWDPWCSFIFVVSENTVLDTVCYFGMCGILGAVLYLLYQKTLSVIQLVFKMCVCGILGAVSFIIVLDVEI